MKTKVLIVDDSAIVRKVLTRELERDPDIEVVGTATDPYAARDKIVSLKPDVITLDIEMPRMDGVTFLRKLMKSYPLPVIIVSGVTPKGCSTSIEALELGALDVMEKPAFSEGDELSEFSMLLCDKIKAAGSASVKKKTKAAEVISPVCRPSFKSEKADKIIAIGASTGGTEAIKRTLCCMPENCPPIIVVQHMPKNFTNAFAKRINELSVIEVLEAEDGMSVQAGRAIIADGDNHLVLKKIGNSFRVSCKRGPLVCRHRPSVEVMFNSVAKVAGDAAIGVILTGMGSDGAQGLKNLRDAGGRTIAQDEQSCVVFGMPKEAIKLNGAEKIVSLDKIPQTMFSML